MFFIIIGFENLILYILGFLGGFVFFSILTWPFAFMYGSNKRHQAGPSEEFRDENRGMRLRLRILDPLQTLSQNAIFAASLTENTAAVAAHLSQRERRPRLRRRWRLSAATTSPAYQQKTKTAHQNPFPLPKFQEKAQNCIYKYTFAVTYYDLYEVQKT